MIINGGFGAAKERLKANTATRRVFVGFEKFLTGRDSDWGLNLPFYPRSSNSYVRG